MRLAPVALVVACACGSGKPKPAPPVPSNETLEPERLCAEAAAGLERGTRSIRPPELSIVNAMRAKCLSENWSVVAIECFTKMTEDDLGRCAGELAEASRDALFVALGGGFDDRTAIAMAIARLGKLEVGISECDRFVKAVARALGCEGMPLDQRAQLGNETAEFWSLPTEKLGADAKDRMGKVCGEALATLEKQVADAGCMP